MIEMNRKRGHETYQDAVRGGSCSGGITRKVVFVVVEKRREEGKERKSEVGGEIYTSSARNGKSGARGAMGQQDGQKVLFFDVNSVIIR
jgi:hypothetical protein